MLIGGVVAIVGFGGGMAMFFMARSEVNPLREQARLLTKKAEDAEIVPRLPKRSPPRPMPESPNCKRRLMRTIKRSGRPRIRPKQPRDSSPNWKASKRLGTGETGRRFAAMVAKKGPLPLPSPWQPSRRRRRQELDCSANVEFDTVNHKAGDRLRVSPKRTGPQGGRRQLRIKFHHELVKGKQLPAQVFATIFIVQAGSDEAVAIPIKLKSPNGDSEAVFDVKRFSRLGECHVLRFGWKRKGQSRGTSRSIAASSPSR